MLLDTKMFIATKLDKMPSSSKFGLNVVRVLAAGLATESTSTGARKIFERKSSLLDGIVRVLAAGLASDSKKRVSGIVQFAPSLPQESTSTEQEDFRTKIIIIGGIVGTTWRATPSSDLRKPADKSILSPLSD